MTTTTGPTDAAPESEEERAYRLTAHENPATGWHHLESGTAPSEATEETLDPEAEGDPDAEEAEADGRQTLNEIVAQHDAAREREADMVETSELPPYDPPPANPPTDQGDSGGEPLPEKPGERVPATGPIKLRAAAMLEYLASDWVPNPEYGAPQYDRTLAVPIAAELRGDEPARPAGLGVRGRPDRRAITRRLMQILGGDIRAVGRTLPHGAVSAIVTSVPYYGLRDYQHPSQIGIEESPAEYVAAIADAFDAIADSLREDGTAWINVGDTFFGDSPVRSNGRDAFSKSWDTSQTRSRGGLRRSAATVDNLRLKDEIGIPWLLAWELRSRGWRGPRPEILWHKPAVKPSGRTTDRVPLAHESVLVMTRARHYRFFLDALPPTFRSSVWTIPVGSSQAGHPAPMPSRLADLCILAATEPGDLVLDPFLGEGTVIESALRLGRRGIGVELREDWAENARRRVSAVTPSLL